MSIETHYTLETPEQIEVKFEVAGPGSRFCALAIDFAMQWLILLACMFVMAVVGFSFAAIFEGRGWDAARGAIAVLVALYFVITTGYYILSEAFMSGQTWGKKALKIRVIRDDATSLTFTPCLIRNLLRFVDFLPFGYLLGGMVSLFHPAHKRLGDLAAGTIVVKEAERDYRAQTDSKVTYLSEQVSAASNTELTPAERQTLTAFLARREELLQSARFSLSERLARQMYTKYGGIWLSAESYIERLLAGEHHGTGGPSTSVEAKPEPQQAEASYFSTRGTGDES